MDKTYQIRVDLRVIGLSLLALFLLGGIYLLGATSCPPIFWPDVHTPLPAGKESSIGTNHVPPKGRYDEYDRLVFFPNKRQVDCPKQTLETGVILAFGQSNSANDAHDKIQTQYPQQVANYFEGKCYVAASPLLGAAGDAGEFITPLADMLIKNGTYKFVVIVSSGIGNTPISRWQEGGDLNELLLSTLSSVRTMYKVTDVVWHQGESDFSNNTLERVYAESFYSLLRSLRKRNVNAPIFIAVATKCGPNNHLRWSMDNPTANAQRKLIDNKKIFLGADTDSLLGINDRELNDCHLVLNGQMKTADAYAEAIKKAHKNHSSRRLG